MDAERKWISVDDRLPLEEREVEIAFFDGTEMCRCFGAFDGHRGSWWTADTEIEVDIIGSKVTHWRWCSPLPAPPSEQQKERLAHGDSDA